MSVAQPFRIYVNLSSHAIRKRDRGDRSKEPAPQCCERAVSFRIGERASSARDASNRTYCV
jgi:hypothetical protein